mmetsp:Transcript_32251/g.94951  ORF Transcript_32251/g.94951 Transcript_32251/m.94951 type:complete len:225 (+) Transcript_32251:2-676(+)
MSFKRPQQNASASRTSEPRQECGVSPKPPTTPTPLSAPPPPPAAAAVAPAPPPFPFNKSPNKICGLTESESSSSLSSLGSLALHPPPKSRPAISLTTLLVTTLLQLVDVTPAPPSCVMRDDTLLGVVVLPPRLQLRLQLRLLRLPSVVLLLLRGWNSRLLLEVDVQHPFPPPCTTFSWPSLARSVPASASGGNGGSLFSKTWLLFFTVGQVGVPLPPFFFFFFF